MRGRQKRYVVHEDVEYLNSSVKAVLVRFPGGKERWVPFSQMPRNFEWEEGKKGDLEVTEWFDERMQEESDEREEADHEVPGVVVLRESDKALRVRVPGHDEEVWIPKTQVRARSAVQHDGDAGLLVVSLWIAQQKGLVEGGGAGARDRDGQDSWEGNRSDVARDVRGRDDLRGHQEEFFPPATDDDLPF